jgi:hypothetical protein
MVTTTHIEATDGLDAITVYWEDHAPGKGSATITCWGSAWTSYWNAMGSRSIQQFFLDVGTDYLVSKLGFSPLLKQRKTDLAYLTCIINAVKKNLKEAV